MDKNLCKPDFQRIINKEKEQGKIKTYSEFCKTKEAEETKLSKEEIEYYTSLSEKKYNKNK